MDSTKFNQENIFYYLGKDIRNLEKDELLIALINAIKLIETMRTDHKREREMYQLFTRSGI